MTPRILFLLKARQAYGLPQTENSNYCSSGLYNSAKFVVDMLLSLGFDAQLKEVTDNNDIDREVFNFKPQTVIIEALWVVPEKFHILEKLHPNVQWIVRVHSEIPFLAYEGIAINWLSRYVQFKNVSIASNSIYGVRDLQSFVHDKNKVHYLPNFYPLTPRVAHKRPDHILDVGCFGAIRPLKNNLIQALAATELARSIGKPLRFHINDRFEQGGDNVLKNIRALMAATGNELVEHPWEERSAFLKTLATTDVGMQVSFSETFDITAADTVTVGVPLVTSNEVVWSSPICQAVPTNTASILNKLRVAIGPLRELIVQMNRGRLFEYSEDAQHVWDQFVLS